MATIIFADCTGRYSGPDYEKRPLGGTESSVIQCARELARRGHAVTVYSNCDAPVTDRGVSWLPLDTPTRPETCDLYIACHQPHLFGFVRKPRRLAVWVLWPVSQLKHYKKLWPMWRYRPIPILMSLYQAKTYSLWLPKFDPQIVLPHGLPEDVRGHEALTTPPPRRAIFASNPQRNLRRLVEIWAQSILPRVPDAVLDVYGLNGVTTNEETWKQWEGTLLPTGLPPHAKASVRLHQPVSRAELIRAMRGSRVMPYLGHKAEAFCLSVAEAQALGVPAVVAPLTVLPERVIDGLTGFIRADAGEFADCTVKLLTDDALWRRQHEAALKYQPGITWSEHAGRLENALLADRFPIYRSVTALPPAGQDATKL
jgi:glycosyltransferase involved in cell wall biosynthesis